MDFKTRRPAQSPADEPMFLVAAKAEAARRGTSLEEVLAADRSAAAIPEFPTAECLLPEDAEEFLWAKGHVDEAQISALSREKADHLAKCHFCQTMISSMEPALSQREEFLKVVRNQTKFAGLGELEGLSDRVYALCRLTWPVLLPGLAVLVLWIGGQLFTDGWLLTATIRSEAVSLLLFMSLSAVAAIAAFVIYMNQRPHIPLLARFAFTISLTVGGAAALTAVVYTSNEWHDAEVALRSSEAILIEKLAASYESKRNNGVFPAIVNVAAGTQINTVGNDKESAIYRASSKDLPGSLVARTRRDKGQISLDVGGKEHNSLDITIGKTERASDGRYRVVSETGESVYGKFVIPSQEAWEGMTAMAVRRSGKESLAELYPLKPVALKKQ